MFASSLLQRTRFCPLWKRETQPFRSFVRCVCARAHSLARSSFLYFICCFYYQAPMMMRHTDTIPWSVDHSCMHTKIGVLLLSIGFSLLLLLVLPLAELTPKNDDGTHKINVSHRRNMGGTRIQRQKCIPCVVQFLFLFFVFLFVGWIELIVFIVFLRWSR